MNTVIIILSILGSIIILLLIIALFAKKEYKTYSEIIILAPKQKVFDYVKKSKTKTTIING